MVDKFESEKVDPEEQLRSWQSARDKVASSKQSESCSPADSWCKSTDAGYNWSQGDFNLASPQAQPSPLSCFRIQPPSPLSDSISSATAMQSNSEPPRGGALLPSAFQGGLGLSASSGSVPRLAGTFTSLGRSSAPAFGSAEGDDLVAGDETDDGCNDVASLRARIDEVTRAIAEQDMELRALNETTAPKSHVEPDPKLARLIREEQAEVNRFEEDLKHVDGQILDLEAELRRQGGRISPAQPLDGSFQSDETAAQQREIRNQAAMALEYQDRIHWLRGQLRRQPSQRNEAVGRVQDLVTQIKEHLERIALVPTPAA
eukprot:TRINITY_DN36954_c0_g1_i1.p1 TRINITY_DN36954_c0_g1~~TRINITY_DN36954_c0_g1_i1.p1  ORF type:complete len:317 (+),score=49.91 TRINITY_DN36954_c0_g1_i1:75-1025(+)